MEHSPDPPISLRLRRSLRKSVSISPTVPTCALYCRRPDSDTLLWRLLSKSGENTREFLVSQLTTGVSFGGEVTHQNFIVITLLLRPRFFVVYSFIILMFESQPIFSFCFNFYTPCYNFILSLPLSRNATANRSPPPPHPWPPPLLLPETYIIWSILKQNWMQTLNMCNGSSRRVTKPFMLHWQ